MVRLEEATLFMYNAFQTEQDDGAFVISLHNCTPILHVSSRLDMTKQYYTYILLSHTPSPLSPTQNFKLHLKTGN